MSEKNSSINLNIEMLRAVAILLTAFSHMGDLFPWGNGFYQYAMSRFSFWGGVDLFFVISGFVICRRLLLISQKLREQKWNLTR